MSVDYAKLKRSQRKRVQELMSDLQWHYYREIERVGGNRYGSRLNELRRLGFQMESREIGEAGDGKEYRFLSNDRGLRQRKRVRVFLEEHDASLLVSSSVITDNAMIAIRNALASFQRNRNKL